MCFLYLYTPKLIASLGGLNFCLAYTFATASARVYYHCHFYGDTLFGALLALPLHYTMHHFGVTQAVVAMCI